MVWSYSSEKNNRMDSFKHIKWYLRDEEKNKNKTYVLT